MNEAKLLGRIGQIRELKTFETGSKVLNFSLATSKRNTKTKENETTWHDCHAWNKLADLLNTWLSVGDTILVNGEIVKREYTVNDEKRISVEIRCKDVEFIKLKKNAETVPDRPTDSNGDVDGNRVEAKASDLPL